MTILRGHFTMMLIVAVGDEVDVEALASDLRETGEALDLELLTIAGVDEVEGAALEAAGASHVVTVYGVDHPGIVNAVAAALAERGVSITDLTTRLVGEEDAPLYALLMEVAVPDDVVSDMSDALAGVGAAQGVEVSVRPLESDAL
jgi:glycine cleavage system transcriptional repressor